MKKLLSVLIVLTLALTLLVGCDPFGAVNRKYHDFTPQEKAILEEYLGEEIPFLSNNGYYLYGLTEDNDYEHGVRFVVVGVTDADVSEYKTALSRYGEAEAIREQSGVRTHIEGEDLVFDLVAYLDENGTLVLTVSVSSKTLSIPVEKQPEDNTGDNTGDNNDNTGDNNNNNPDAPGTDTEQKETAYYLSCRNANALIYFTGAISEGRFAGSDSEADAVAVYIEKATGGYVLYIKDGDAKSYLCVDDSSSGAGFTASRTSASIFEWDTVLKTMKVAEDSNNRALGMKTDSTYTTFSTYDAQNSNYNYATFKNAQGVEFTPDGGSVGEDTGDSGSGDATHRYTDFTSEEKGYFRQYLGALIPFIANDEYYLDDYYGTAEQNFAYGFNFYTFGNTEAEFEAYRSTIAKSYELYDQYTDDYGDTWYTYYNGDIFIDISYYEYEGDRVVDLYAYSETLSEDMEDDGSGDNSGDDGGNTGTDPDVDLITNDGKGLPKDTDGVVDVDLKDAEIVKDVTDQGYYLDGCPTVGSPAVLVIPVEFSDVTAASRGYTVDKILTAFTGAYGTTDYYSVEEYYKISSYGQLDLDITVLDSWFRPKYSSSYYLDYQMSLDGQSIEAGDMLILHEVLSMLEGTMDLSRYDSDGNGTIDAIVLINTLDIDSDANMTWAYRYWNMYTDNSGDYYEYDGVYANDYMWASFAFLYETYDEEGNISYTDKNAMNTYTFIHEFGHILGADDYYDTAGGTSPMDGCDIMDGMTGDHNAFTKFNYGWLTESRLVVTDSSVTLTLEDFSKSGDTIIIANNWDEALGAYQEYFIVVYYTNNGLNGTEESGYFARDGIVVYHINASLYREVVDGTVYYDIYNNNTSPYDEYGTEDNLIEFVKSANDTYTYTVNDTLPETELSSGESLIYTFVVISMNESTATITFTKIA